MILNLYKSSGETPLECIERFRLALPTHPEYADISVSTPMSYAGRLDPLASGVLLVLAGEEANQSESRALYLALDKVYTFDIVFGVETDTYDLLGLAKIDASKDPSKDLSIASDLLKKELCKFQGKLFQKYPPFSSKTVQGRPLFEWAKSARLDEIEIPSREIELYTIDLLKISEISAADLQEKALEAAASVRGDFRQQEITTRWQEIFSKNQSAQKPQTLRALPSTFPLISLRVSCSSGTYVRGLAHSLGQALGTAAIAMNILRERAGEFELADSIR